jgi:glycosyltransferase involved in cell wall biosynthesis
MTFMALAGSGAILKGLDLVVEAFASTPGRTLHIVGALEADFLTAYGPLISAAPNIHSHGFLRFGSRKLTKLLNTCSVIISPSCSEGMSSAVVTGIACGMYPIISRQTGVDLPTNSGLYLENLSVDAIHSAIEEYTKISRDDVTMAATQGATEARERYSRVHRAKQIRLDVAAVLAAS